MEFPRGFGMCSLVAHEATAGANDRVMDQQQHFRKANTKEFPFPCLHFYVSKMIKRQTDASTV
jgi:hypothetical protein